MWLETTILHDSNATICKTMDLLWWTCLASLSIWSKQNSMYVHIVVCIVVSVLRIHPHVLSESGFQQLEIDKWTFAHTHLLECIYHMRIVLNISIWNDSDIKWSASFIIQIDAVRWELVDDWICVSVQCTMIAFASHISTHISHMRLRF